MVLQRTQLELYLYRTFRWMLVVWVIFQLSIVGLSQVLFESFKPINHKVLKGFVFKTINNVHSYFQCYKECDDSREVTCYSINFYPSKGVCELNYAADWLKPSHMAVDYKGTHLSNLERKKDPSRNCKVLKESFPQAPSGNYLLNIVGGLDPFLGYCDMETEGGGWTLVWSFTFSTYPTFTSKANYVKPLPKNMYSTILEQSNTPPRNETDMNAIDFQYWKEIGAEFLIKSNINNWVACLPGDGILGGSLVTNTVGGLKCRFVKKIVNSPCSEYPGRLAKWQYGINLLGSTTGGAMYYFENSNTENWPTHDPCANNAANHKKNVANPHTNVYIRKQT